MTFGRSLSSEFLSLLTVVNYGCLRGLYEIISVLHKVGNQPLGIIVTDYF